ncbi:PfkB family carbohydrate kinase [Spiroplasma apis]|uniref:1-phosphofructokinase n=1 Tax=Spiroplasma apis B31 TaxID=1276258 RepID=V5RHA1_SPIAP|nr:PfkB family carbohydrate kinase [Spiroplasma apis]AHB36032.1 1-phosphofructokinase [Spiroplasma apis B31]
MEKKIYITSLNPSIEYKLYFDELVKHKKNQSYKSKMKPFTKVLHIGRIFKKMDWDVIPILFIPPHFGSLFKNEMEKENMNLKWFQAKGDIRISVKLADNDITECNTFGAPVSQLELRKMKSYFYDVLQENDIVVSTGTVPPNVDNSIIRDICEIANINKARFVTDVFGEPLRKLLGNKVFLYKTNIEELELTMGKKINNQNDLIISMSVLLNKGIENILVCKNNNLILANNQNILEASFENLNLQNKEVIDLNYGVLAGFLDTFIKTNDFESALKSSLLVGNAIIIWKHSITKEKISTILKQTDQIKIRVVR